MFLIFSLGRLDVLPVDDLGLKKGIQLMFSLNELPKGEQIEKLAKKWKPYRTIATWYLWKSLKKFDTIGQKSVMGPAGFEPATSSTPGWHHNQSRRRPLNV